MACPPGYTRRPVRAPMSSGGSQASAPPVGLSSKSRPAHCSSSSSCTQSASSPSGTSKSQSRQRWENQRRREARCCRGQPLAGGQLVSGGGREQEPPQPSPRQGTRERLPPGLQTVDFLHQGCHPDGAVPGLPLRGGEETEVGAGICKGRGGGWYCHPWTDTDPQLGVAQVEVLVQQPPQGAKRIFGVIHKEVTQLCGKDREGLACAGIPRRPPRSLAGHGALGPTCLAKSRAAPDLPARSFLRRTPR